MIWVTEEKGVKKYAFLQDKKNILNESTINKCKNNKQ